MSTDNPCDKEYVLHTSETSDDAVYPVDVELSSGDTFSKGHYNVIYTFADQASNTRKYDFDIFVYPGIEILFSFFDTYT